MKIMLLFLFFGISMGYATTGHSQTMRLSLDMNNSSIKDVFSQIERNSNFVIFYSDNVIDVNKKVNITAKDETVEQVLTKVLASTDNTYVVVDNQIFISHKKADKLEIEGAKEQVQQPKIKGIVKDTDGNPLVGVTVAVKGVTRATMTDIDGAYEISATSTESIVFSYIGFHPQEVKVGNKPNVDVVLVENSKILDEVIVVGYGVQSKSSLTAAISQVDGKALLTTPSTNISSILGGRIAGVTSVQESGQPGQDQAGLKIRGSKVGALYIVDGIPRPINDVHPNDVETVSVLKDAAAAAVYGLDAAGGVVIVTTKKGKKGAAKLSYDGSFGISQNTSYPEFLDAPSYAYYYNRGLELDGGTAIFSEEHLRMMQNGDPTDGWGNTNWIDEVFGTGTTQKHNITLSGGGDKFSYFTSLAYMNQEGNVDKFGYKRYNLRTNLEAEIANNLKMVVGISGIRTDQQSPAFSAGGGEGAGYQELAEWMSIARQTVQMHPYLPKMVDGKYTASPNNLQQPSSPLAAIEQSGSNKSNAMIAQTNIELIWSLPWVSGLSLGAKGAYDYSNTTSKNLSTPYRVMLPKPIGSTVGELLFNEVTDVRNFNNISLLEGTNRTDRLVGHVSANYARSFNTVHNVNAMILGEARDMKNRSFSAKVQDIPFPELPELELGNPSTSGRPINGTSRIARSVGLVFRLRYDYSGKYLAELSGRYDGSHKFAGNVPGKQWGFFPSGSAGWRVSEENFMKGIEMIDNLKLRGAIGLSGSAATVSDNAFAFLSAYTPNGAPIILGNGAVNAMYPSLFENPNLTWEKVRTMDIGFDLSLWKGKLSLEFDAFYNYNYDIIGPAGADMPPSMGKHFPITINKNRIEMKGFDLSFGHDNSLVLGGKTFSYGAKLNMTFSKSKWLRYDDSENIPDYQKVVGKPYDTQLIYKANGLFRSEEEIDNAAWRGNTRPRVGDIRYVDLNGDGIINSQDKGHFGRGNNPEFTAGLNLYADWNGFDMNLLFVGSARVDASLASSYYNGNDDTTILTGLFKGNANSPRYLAEGAWSPENPNGIYPRLSVNTPTNDNGYASTFWIRDAKYLRLKSAQVGYTIPRLLTQKASLDVVRVFVEGSNLFTWTGLPDGLDPEMPRVVNAYYPQQRTFMGGVSITF